MGYFNVYRQLNRDQKLDVTSQIVLVTCLLTCLMKLFFFLRIYQTLTYIVTMIIQVVNDLQAFFVYFMSFIFIGSLVFDLLGGNPSHEYREIGPFSGNVMYTLRLSLGNFDFSTLEDPNKKDWEQRMFWITWYSYVIFGTLIFLNFIIAEVSNSYEIVRENINQLIYKERAGLIAEVEAIMLDSTIENNPHFFPKYLVSREVEP